ncbi:MAG: hypothetical protein R2695_10185 [Acidimicrobiales bacterium]
MLLEPAVWGAFATRLNQEGVEFVIEPVRFAGTVGGNGRCSCWIPRGTPSSSRRSPTASVFASG